MSDEVKASIAAILNQPYYQRIAPSFGGTLQDRLAAELLRSPGELDLDLRATERMIHGTMKAWLVDHLQVISEAEAAFLKVTASVVADQPWKINLDYSGPAELMTKIGHYLPFGDHS